MQGKSQHFTQTKLLRTPVVFFKLQAANGLEISSTSYAVLDLDVGFIKIFGCVVLGKDGL